MIKNEKWTEESFLRKVEETSKLYKTGEQINLLEAVAYHKSLPEHKKTINVYKEAAKNGTTVIMPRAGVATLEQMKSLLKYLEIEGGADILPVTTDSYTRRLLFDKAEKALEDSYKTGKSMLNGFPAALYGVEGCRELLDYVNKPLSGRSAISTPEFTDTIQACGGTTEFVSGGISFGLHNEAKTPIEDSIRGYQYVDRLIGWFEERGVSICREADATSGCALINPPSIAAAVAVVDSLLAAEQGAKHLLFSYYLNNSIIQDLAGINVQKKLCDYYLKKNGYSVELFQSANQWHGPYPEDPAKAFAIIGMSTLIAVLGGVTKIMVRSIEEGVGIPTKEGNADALRATRMVIKMMKGQKLPDFEEVAIEEEIIEKEAKAIVDKLFDLGDGDIAVGLVKGFETGLMDVPFTPNKYAKGKILMVKDTAGAARYLDHGGLPFPKECIEYEQEKIHQRRLKENFTDEYEMMVHDLFAFAR